MAEDRRVFTDATHSYTCGCKNLGKHGSRKGAVRRARYLDAKTSRWLTTDPALGEYIPMAPVNDEAKKHNQNLPGGGIYNTLSTHLYNYANNNPIKYEDPDGRAPRNLTENQRKKYKENISSIDVSKAPKGIVCSTYAAYNYSNAMEAATDEKKSYKNLQHDGTKLTGLWGFYASDFYNETDGPENFSFYTDSKGNRDSYFNSSNIEVGTIGVFGTKNPKGWSGHIWTVTGVTRDDKGNVISINIVEGHQSRRPNSATITAEEFQKYINGTGPFLGWGEMGKNSALVRDNNNSQLKVTTNETQVKD